MILNLIKYLIKFSCVLGFVFSSNTLNAQEERGYLSFKGETYLNNAHLSGAQIKVYRNGRVFAQTTSSRKGKFELKLEYFHKYKVEFYYSGCYKTFIDVNADIPRSLLPHWATFVIKVPFFNENDTTVDASLFKQSITSVLFDETKKKFIDQNQFKTSSPATANIPFINSKPINETPVNVNAAEKKEVLKQDAKENIAIKRKAETELIKKVRTHHNKLPETETGNNKTEWNNTIQRNSAEERNLVIEKEENNNLIITETETADLLKKKASAKTSKQNAIRIVAKDESGLFESSFKTLVYKNDKLFMEFIRLENTFTGNSFYINKKEVSSTEYYLKIKQYTK